MPTVHYEGQTIACETGDRLRSVLLKAGANPHNGQARWMNCKGFGTCGTCAVKVEGPVSAMGTREKGRLSFPPHSPTSGLRLACQTKVMGDITVTKFAGFWGQEIHQVREPERNQ